MSDTNTRLEGLLRQYSGMTTPITDNMSIEDDLALDSLDRIELVQKCEDEFRVSITDDEVDDPATATVGGLAALIDEKRCDIY